jgi:hypothetical protein
MSFKRYKNHSKIETSSSSNYETCSSNQEKPSTVSSLKLQKCAEKLKEVKKLMQEVQCCLRTYNQRSSE